MTGANYLQLKLITLLGEKYDEPVYGVTLPSKTGPITIFPNHEPLVTLLNPGEMIIRRHKDDPDMKLELLALNGGIARITQGEIIILTDEAESNREIAEQEAKAAYERALAAANSVTDYVELEEAKRLVQHQAARLKIAKLRRRHHDIKK